MDQGKEDWISKRVDEALRAYSVAGDVALTVKQRLAGAMCERALRTRELTELAKILIDTTTTPPREETDK